MRTRGHHEHVNTFSKASGINQERSGEEDGVSLNQWIASAVAEKVGAVETAAGFFKRRAGKAKSSDLLWFLDHAPAKPPAHGDEKE